ncbi:MAG: hypothetical protein LBJ00_02650 [Planctomycetaceae bacterium]|jgi:uncharacterized membrane protein|nr:hypothetical protein [Planctomycetaceae bacterium]
MSEPVQSIKKPNTNDFLRCYRWLITGITVSVIGCVLLTAAFLFPENVYALSYTFWYADIRYWSDWISDCCWLVLVWSIISTLLALFVPKNEKRIFLLRRTFFQNLNSILFLLLIWSIWYNYATLPLNVLFEPVTSPVADWVHKNYSLPLANYFSNNQVISPVFFIVIVVSVIVVLIVIWRVRFRRQKQNKSETIITALIFLLLLPTILGADKITPPKKVEASKGIYDVKSKDDLANFTTEDIKKLVKMEYNRFPPLAENFVIG